MDFCLTKLANKAGDGDPFRQLKSEVALQIVNNINSIETFNNRGGGDLGDDGPNATATNDIYDRLFTMIN
jgi:hypothetical protein